MKKTKIFILALFLCLGMATMGLCYIITDAGPYLNSEVGGLDYVEGWISKPYFDAFSLSGNDWEQETAWANLVLSPESVTFYAKDESVTYYNTDEAGVYAFPMTTPPVSEYFLLKNAQWYSLLRNETEMGWGVFAPTLLPSGMNLNSFVISHVDRFDGTSTPVPEPATMLLLVTGLVGFAGFGRKKFFKK